MHEFLLYNNFIISLYMFRALCANHQEVKIVLHSIWYHHTCRWPSGAQDERGLLMMSTQCSKHVLPNFDVLLTVHLSIISVINQLNAQILVL